MLHLEQCFVVHTFNVTKKPKENLTSNTAWLSPEVICCQKIILPKKYASQTDQERKNNNKTLKEEVGKSSTYYNILFPKTGGIHDSSEIIVEKKTWKRLL